MAEFKIYHNPRSAKEVIRKKGKIYKELRLDDPATTEDDLIRAIVQHPILLERPIVVRGNRAVLARPTEKINEIL